MDDNKPWEKLEPTFSLVEDRLRILRQTLPEAFTDGKINFETLKELLGEAVADEEPDEHFGLSWTGKREARKLAGMPSKGTLFPVKGKGLHEDTTENIFIEGDNLEVLKLLHKSYYGKIKMIYIDPPYNTGNDFIYKDDYKMPLESYLQRSGQMNELDEMLTSNPKSSGRFHSDWLNMLYPRLRVAKDLLREDGVIFVSIDDNEVHNLRQMMNEIFGEENFVAILTIINNAKGRNDKKNVAPCHEYLVVFAMPNFESYGFPLTEEQLKQFKFIDHDGFKYGLRDLRKRGGADRRQDRPKMYFPLYYNQTTKEFSLDRTLDSDVEITPQKSDGSDGCWRWGKEKVSKNLDILEASYIPNKDRWNVNYRIFLDLNRFPDAIAEDDEKDEEDEDLQRTSKSKSFWMGGEISTDTGRKEFKKIFPEIDFDFPKSPHFIKKVLTMSAKNNDLCLDFYAGSGTTAQSLFELNFEDNNNRKFICVQIDDKVKEDSIAYKAGFRTISEITAERIRRASRKIEAEIDAGLPLSQKPDLGFKFYRLERSNFKAWSDYQGTNLDELRGLLQAQVSTSFIETATKEGILTEILLLEGFPLDSTVEQDETFERNTVWRVSSEFTEHRLFITLDEEIWEETIMNAEELESNDIFICLDKALGDESKIRLSDVCRLKVI